MKKNIINLIPVFISVFLLIGTITVSSILIPFKLPENETKNQKLNISGNSERVKAVETMSTKKSNDKSEEMRAVWVPYMSLNMSGTDKSEKAFHKKIDTIIQKCQQYKLNTIIIHVRPNGDALYPSKYFPWSDILTGSQGKNPGYDPLDYIIKSAHKQNIKVHAWINPLRIRFSKTPEKFSDDNPYTVWKNDDNKESDRYTFESGSNIYYNPAYSEVRELIINGVKEVVENYDVDGIQFDDYFYPEDDEKCDAEDYNKYLSTVDDNYIPLSKSEWHKTNINTLISGVYSAIHSIKENVDFGISPQCNIKNNEKLSADIKTWGSVGGYVDYLCPQIYVSNTHPYLPFRTSADQWNDIIINKNIKYYIGLGVYKAGSDKDNGTWLESNEILKNQVLYGRSIDCNGFMLYSYDYLDTEDTRTEVQNVISLF